jgi:chaperonin GroES
MSNALKSVPNVGDIPTRRKESMAVNVRPLHDRVIAKGLHQEATSKGGIIIPDTAKEKSQEGRVVAVGPGRRNDDGKIVPLGVETGDRILFAKYSGTEVEIDGEKYLILQEHDILGVIENEKGR